MPTQLFKTTDKPHKNRIKLKGVCKQKSINSDSAPAKRPNLKQKVHDPVVNFVSDMLNKFVKTKNKNTLKEQAK